MTSRQGLMLQMIEHTQYWSECNQKQRKKIENLFKWARNVVQSNDGVFWMARVFRRAFIYLSLDIDPANPKKPVKGKWFYRAKKLDSQGYSLEKAVKEVCFFIQLQPGIGTSQFETVFTNLRQKAARLGKFDIDKINPTVLKLVVRGAGGEGMGHKEDCPATKGGHCNCGWRDIERKAAELAPMRGPIAVALGIANLRYTNPDGTDRPTDAVYQELNQIGSSLEAIEKLPEGKTIIQLPDGAKWVSLDCHGNEYEGKLMGHCGNQGGKAGDKLLSLRVPSTKFMGFFEPKLTFIFDPRTGALGEMKGFGNKKPDKAYHKDILELLKNKMVKKLNGMGYLPSNNFSINDLSDEDLHELAVVRPDLIKAQLTSGDQFQKISQSRYQKLTGEKREKKPAPTSRVRQPTEPEDDEREDLPLPE